MRNIFFDLDGTLVDSKQRLYRLFCDLLPGLELSFSDYWDLKKQQVGHEKIISKFKDFAQQTFKEFQEKWMKKIETKEYLELDKPFSGINEMLTRLKINGNAITIITSRQSPELAEWQINKWGWQEYLTKILVTKQVSEKIDIIRKNFFALRPTDIIIGDTGKDIETGRQLNILSIAVLSGFRNKETLEKYKPDYIFNSVTDIDFEKI